MARARWAPATATLTLAAAVLGLLLAEAAPPTAFGAEVDDAACFPCHNNPKWRMEFTLPSGETLSLYFDKDKLRGSVHGALHCVDCHTDKLSGFPHDKLPEGWDRRDLTLNLSTTCQRCHPQAHRAIAESVHYGALAEGNRAAPACTDCHGAHDVQPVDQARAALVQRCGGCHQDIYDAYARSIHGVAVLQRGSPDAATCADCHGSHKVRNPQATEFRARSPWICARCHANEAMMSKYGLSADVFRTYLADFHGATVALFRERPSGRLDAAVCYDCHGSHSIVTVDAVTSPVSTENLLKTCQRCHPGTTSNFTGAWLGHHRPSPRRFPAVYYARLAYKVLIPGVIAFFIIVITWDMVHGIVQRMRSPRLERARIKEEEP